MRVLGSAIALYLHALQNTCGGEKKVLENDWFLLTVFKFILKRLSDIWLFKIKFTLRVEATKLWLHP